jgi:hypothetical protein
MRQHILNSAGKQDYDVLQFNSNSDDGVNATLNLLNYDLALKGVARIISERLSGREDLSSGKRGHHQEGTRLHLRWNVQAGKLQYHGKEYYFHYDALHGRSAQCGFGELHGRQLRKERGGAHDTW